MQVSNILVLTIRGKLINFEVEATCFSEISIDFQRTARNCIPEGRTLHNPQCKNLKFYKHLFGVQDILNRKSSDKNVYLLRSVAAQRR
jgi:hypothetical protein